MAMSAMPVHPAHKFKPGQSGNPKGRPKGAKNESTILREIFERKIESQTGNRSRKITILEGICSGSPKTRLRVTPRVRHSCSIATPRWFRVSFSARTSTTTTARCSEAFAQRIDARRTSDGGKS